MVFLGENEYNEYLQRIFGMFDFEGSHTIDLDIFKMLFETLGHPISATEIPKMEKKIESEGRDGISYSEFIERYLRYYPVGNVLEDLKYAFDESSENGSITYNSLKKANDSAKLGFTDDEIKAIIKEFDATGDGSIQFDEITKRFETGKISVNIEYPDSLKPQNTVVDDTEE